VIRTVVARRESTSPHAAIELTVVKEGFAPVTTRVRWPVVKSSVTNELETASRRADGKR